MKPLHLGVLTARLSRLAGKPRRQIAASNLNLYGSALNKQF
jgi:hypothetical protein